MPKATQDTKSIAIKGTGLKMNVPDDMVFAFSDGEYYEKNLAYWFNKFLSSSANSVFYDIGANIGYYSLLASQHCAQVYSFEPVNSTAKVLRSNIKGNKIGNVSVLPYGVGKETMESEIHIYSSSGNNSVHERKIPEGSDLVLLERQKIDVVSLDEIVEASELLPPTLIKIDIEGAELDALSGAAKILEKYQPVVLCEYSTSTSQDAGYHRRKIVRLLRSLGYKIYGLSENYDDMRLYPIAADRVKKIDNLVALPPGEHNIINKRYVRGAISRSRRLLSRDIPPKDEQPPVSYSQSGEDLIIDFVLKNSLGVDSPTYLDIGANHPVNLSNTYLFYQRGCRGILVEPDPSLAESIRLKRPEDTLLEVGVGKDKSELDFYIFNPPTLNTFSKEEVEHYKISFPYAELVQTIKVEVVPINSILKQHFKGGPDFLSLDVEGIDFEILSSLDIKKYRPKVICVETIDFEDEGIIKPTKIANYLHKNGYFLYADTFINSIFVDESYWNKMKQPKLKSIGR